MPIGSIVVPFWGSCLTSYKGNPKKELLWSLMGRAFRRSIFGGLQRSRVAVLRIQGRAPIFFSCLSSGFGL